MKNFKKMYNSSNHSKFRLKAHVILTPKYRKSVLVAPISTKMKEILMEISNRIDSKFNIDILETDRNHIHLMIDYEPTATLSQIVRRLKQLSQHRIWKLFPNELRSFYWRKDRHLFWSDGYFVASTGEASSKIIYHYIKNQG